MENFKKKKLVLISLVYEPYWSGAEKMVKEIAERLQDKYEITIITSQLKDNLPVLEEIGHYTIKRVGKEVNFFGKLFFPWRAAILASKLQPDIVHAVMESYAGGALVILKYLYPRARRVLTLQSGDLDEQEKKKQFFLRVFWRAIHRAPHLLTAISLFLAKRAERFGRRREEISVIPNGVAWEKIALIKEEKKLSQVICVGRFSWEKGHQFLLAAWPLVLAKVPSAKLILVGEGVLQAEIARQIQDLGISASVSLLGSLPHDQALGQIARSSVFVCPSLAEGLGIVFIEAQACGVPPIGTNVGGIPEIILDGESGLLVEPKNSEAIASAVIKLLTDRALAEKIKRNGLSAARRFAWADIVRRYEALYERSTSR